MPYVATEWKDGTAPALNADNLNKLETGLVAATVAAEKATSWADITGKPATFAPTIGTTATTAKAGNYTPAWGDVTGKPAVIAAGENAAAARTAIGAGTSNLAIGTTATTAKAGNWTPAIGDIPTGTTATTVALGNHTHAASAISVTATGTLTGANAQAALESLAARIAALETP